MAANDNAMTRFLFAILKQKCLKDIDWNKVAHDPILAQEITNGHAARMRYSRFRSAMLGLEPQRRNRTNQNKPKVSKPKKESKAKKEETIKQEPGTADQKSATADPAAPDMKSASESPKIKEEAYAPPVIDSQALPVALTGITMPEQAAAAHHFHARLLTPCSDTDLLAAAQGYAASPASDIFKSEASLEFHASAHCAHDQASWHQNTAYAPFSTPYEVDGFSIDISDHQNPLQSHNLQPHPSQLCAPTAIMEPELQGTLRHEEWNIHYR